MEAIGKTDKRNTKDDQYLRYLKEETIECQLQRRNTRNLEKLLHLFNYLFLT